MAAEQPELGFTRCRLSQIYARPRIQSSGGSGEGFHQLWRQGSCSSADKARAVLDVNPNPNLLLRHEP
ncbi:hypothetical protein CesoFtcFv8_020397 [Champsocephalus esox]|uniref:Uncharacterized protein n=1 Tax=Champsocephalus esox TaxID=159716 RepID=A0AAN8GLX9_9TELE|nr:hypothetical protein CesoFtcFv8_020397 [Champsocephalus esox]